MMKKIVGPNSSHDNTLSGGPSTSAPSITNLYRNVLSVVLDYLDPRELIRFVRTTQKAWSLVHHYFGHQDKKVDLSDLSMPETITDDSLKLFSKCKDINLWGCYQITDVGLAHLKEVTSINLWGSQITNAGLAQFKILNPTCKIYGK